MQLDQLRIELENPLTADVLMAYKSDVQGAAKGDIMYFCTSVIHI